jgi:alpha-galactosidase
MAANVTLQRSGSGASELVTLSNGRATIAWGPGAELTLFEHAGIQTHVAGGPLIEVVEGTRGPRPATVGLGRDTSEDLAADAQPFEDALGSGLRAHRTFPVAGWPLVAELDIAVYQHQPWVTLALRLTNVGARPVTLNRLFPFVSGHAWGEHPMSLGGHARQFSVSKQGWQSWNFAGGLPPGAPDVRPTLEAGSLWHNPGGTSFRDPLGDPVDVVSDGMVLIGTDEGYPALLAGFIGAAHHFGQFYVDRARGSLTAATLLHEHVLNPGEHVESEPLILGAGHPASLLQAYAESLAAWHGSRPSAGPVTGWCSWYQYFASVTESNVLANLAALRAARPLAPLELIQIDDGYQRAVGDWTRINETFPSGMAPLAQRIREAGFRPGIWVAPFTVAANSRLAAEHPEWLVQQRGQPAFAGTNWQTTLYGLDTTHPGAREWLRRLFSTLVEGWGFDYLKLDFLYTGAVPGQRYNVAATGAEALRHGLELIRSAVGERVYLLGCGCPLLSAVGLVDAMRIGPDVAPVWSASAGSGALASDALTSPNTERAVHNILARAWMHPTLWTNDPDCVLARDRDTELTCDEVCTLATAAGLCGGITLISDAVPALTLERLKLVACLLPPLRETARPARYFEPGISERVVTQIERPWGSWLLVGLFNQASTPRQLRTAWHQLGLAPGAYHATEFWSGTYLGCSEEGAALTLAPHGAAVLAVHAAQTDPCLLSTSFHISQGGVEVASWEYEADSQRVRWTTRLGRSADGTFMLWMPPHLWPRRLVSTARNAHWRRHEGSSSVILVEAEIADHAEFALELESAP